MRTLSMKRVAPPARAGTPFWDRPEHVEWSARRRPDPRLTELFAGHSSHLRVLDVGCGAGRNTVWCARQGFDVHALDASRPMVTRTRARLARVLGDRAARRRVRRGTMTDLGTYPDASFDLVVCLGVLSAAPTAAAWHAAVAEIARVLRPGAAFLLTHFAPGPDHAAPVRTPRIAGPARSRHADGGCRSHVLRADELDRDLARHGFAPTTPTVPSPLPNTNPSEPDRTVLDALYHRSPAKGAAR